MKTTITVVLLLGISNAFMTIAWYGHLRFKNVSLATTIACELADRGVRVLFSGSGEPDWLRAVQRNATEDHAGSDLADGLLGVRVLSTCVKPQRVARRVGFLLIRARWR